MPMSPDEPAISTLVSGRVLSDGVVRVRVDPTRPVDLHMLPDQLLKAGPLGQVQDRRQTRAHDEVGIIEDGAEAVAGSHPADAVLCGSDLALDKNGSPATEGHSCVTTHRPVGRWIEA